MKITIDCLEDKRCHQTFLEGKFAGYKEIINQCKENKFDLTIAIPTYKRPKLLAETLKSAVNQSGTLRIEIIVVDNDCELEFFEENKSTINSLSGCNIKYFLNEKNLGMFGNWNQCISLSSSEYLTILNDDDILHPNWAEVVYKYKDIGLILVHTKNFKDQSDIQIENNVSDEKLVQIKNDEIFLKMVNPGSLGILMNKKSAIQIGGFIEDFGPAGDYHFFFKMIKYRNEIFQVNKTLAFYRWDKDNASQQKGVAEKFIISNNILRRALLNCKAIDSLLNIYSLHEVRKIKHRYPFIDKGHIKAALKINIYESFAYFLINMFGLSGLIKSKLKRKLRKAT